MENRSKYSTGIKFGLMIGLVYIILLFLRYNFFGKNPLIFGIFAIVSYLIILVFYLFAGIARRKEQGGFAKFQEIFQTIFIAIVITEIVYVLFNFVYLKYIDPSFFDSLKEATRSMMEKAGATQEQIDKQLDNFKDVDAQLKPLKLLQGIAIWIVVDSLFGMIYAAILRKKKDLFEENQIQ